MSRTKRASTVVTTRTSAAKRARMPAMNLSMIRSRKRSPSSQADRLRQVSLPLPKAACSSASSTESSAR